MTNSIGDLLLGCLTVGELKSILTQFDDDSRVVIGANLRRFADRQLARPVTAATVLTSDDGELLLSDGKLLIRYNEYEDEQSSDCTIEPALDIKIVVLS